MYVCVYVCICALNSCIICNGGGRMLPEVERTGAGRKSETGCVVAHLWSSRLWQDTRSVEEGDFLCFVDICFAFHALTLILWIWKGSRLAKIPLHLHTRHILRSTCSLHMNVNAGLSGIDALHAGCLGWIVRRWQRTDRCWHPYASSCKLSINLVCIIYAVHENGDGLLDSCCNF